MTRIEMATDARMSEIERFAADVLRRRGEDDPPFVSVEDVQFLIAEYRHACRLLDGLLFNAQLDHPLPWRVEHDWGITVESKTGRVFHGDEADCQEIVQLGEMREREMGEFSARFERFMSGETGSLNEEKR